MTVSVNAQMPPIEPGVPFNLARWRAAHYSDVRYKLNLTLEKMSPVLRGTIEIRVNVSGGASTGSVSEPPASAGGQKAGGTIPLIILDWRKIKGHEEKSTISNVFINGKKVLVSTNWPPANAGGSDYSEHLIFRDGVVSGENVLKLDFTSPILTSGSAITRYVDKEDGSEYLYSLFVPSDASTAFPVFDQPDLKARFTLEMTYPSDWKSVSNAQSSGVLLGDRWKTSFQETQPISTYVFAFAAGNFELFKESTTSVQEKTYKLESPSSEDKLKQPIAPRRETFIYVRKSQAEKFKQHAPEVFRLTREGVKYLEEYFDYKFPFPKYDVVLIPEFPFGGMEHAGATFLREDRVIFPQEPTANDHITRANVIFHEAAHQWFGDTVTMRWFDDLWLKEGFAEFMAYKTLEKTMPQYNAWKAFYERNKQAAYLTDSTKGTTPIYQPIENLSAAKSAYGNIVYRKAPSFLKQAEFYLGPDKFQTAVRSFLKEHEYANATWQDLVSEFEAASGRNLKDWASTWVTKPELPTVRTVKLRGGTGCFGYQLSQAAPSGSTTRWQMRLKPLVRFTNGRDSERDFELTPEVVGSSLCDAYRNPDPVFLMPNYGDYGYGIFLLDDKSRDYVLKNIQNEKDDFLRSMMWGALWDSVREAELDPRQYVELAIKNLGMRTPSSANAVNPVPGSTALETDETIIALVLARVATAMTYYMPDAERVSSPRVSKGAANQTAPSLTFRLQTRTDNLQSRLEATLIDRMRTAPTLGQRITYYRAFLNIVSTEKGRTVLKQILKGKFGNTGGNASLSKRAPTQNTARSLTVASLPVKTKDKFDIITRLAILNDPDAPKLLADLEKTENSDDAKRYAYAARAAFPTKENREKFWNDFINNKDISESWIEAAMQPFNSPKHANLSLPYLQRALAELPNLKRGRKIFFVNGWLGAFIGGQKSQEALDIVNKFLEGNPDLDRDLRLKVLENVDIIERAVKIRRKFEKS